MPKFDAQGLVTAMVVDAADNEPLMLAHMNEEALLKTIETGEAHYYSRSRQQLWHKGATSGLVQTVEQLLIDDALSHHARSLDSQRSHRNPLRVSIFQSSRRNSVPDKLGEETRERIRELVHCFGGREKE